MLLIAQALLVISASLPVYLFAKQKLSQTAAVLMAAAFLLCPLLIRLIYFDFHEIAFAIPLIAWSIYLIERNKSYWSLLPIAGLLLVKENLSILVVFFGMYMLLKNKKISGLIAISTGIAWFFLATKLFIPYFAGTGKSFNYWTYDKLGKDLPGAIMTMLTSPATPLSLLITPPVKIITFIKSFGFLLGLNFLSPICILVIPLILERFLSSNENYWQYNFHYGALLAPVIFMAAIDGLWRLSRLRVLSSVPKNTFYVAVSSIVAALTLIIFITTPMSFIFKPTNYSLNTFEKAGYETLMRLDETSGSVCTTNHIAPHVGKFNLQLIGFGVAPQQSLRCNTIVVSDTLDQSDILMADLRLASDKGFKEEHRNNGWAIYSRRP